MAKVKSQLRFGQWPDSLAAARLQPELTVAARRLAAAALEELGKLGVTVHARGNRTSAFRGCGNSVARGAGSRSSAKAT